jgi:transposase
VRSTVKRSRRREERLARMRELLEPMREYLHEFSYRLDRNKLRQARSREGSYLLRTNLVEEDPAKLWSHYLLLVAVEEAFKNLKGDLAIRPVFHQLEARIEAHIFFISFLAYCLHVTLARRLHALAPG